MSTIAIVMTAGIYNLLAGGVRRDNSGLILFRTDKKNMQTGSFIGTIM